MKNIILNEFRQYIRSPFMVVVLIMFPIIMIYILGNLVENVQNADETIGTMNIAYTSEIVDFSANMSNEQLSFYPVTQQEGIEMLANDEADGYFQLDASGVTLYEGPSVLTNGVVKGIANGFLLQKSVWECIATNNIESIPHISLQEEEYTTKRDTNASMTMFDYYVIAMTIMTGMYACLASSMTFTEERKNRTMNRLITSPMNKGKIFAAKCLGQIPFAMLQVGILLIFSAIFFNAQYIPGVGGKLLLFLLLMMTAVVSSVVGVIISLIFQRSMAVVLFLILWVMLLLSGCFAKAMTLEPVCNFFPPYIVRQACFSLNVFGKYAPAVKVIVVEVIMFTILILLGGWIFSRKQEERI